MTREKQQMELFALKSTCGSYLKVALQAGLDPKKMISIILPKHAVGFTDYLNNKDIKLIVKFLQQHLKAAMNKSKSDMGKSRAPASLKRKPGKMKAKAKGKK